jgi:hypothetical protein
MTKAIVIGLALTASAWAADHVPPGYKLVYEQDFDQPGVLSGFAMTDPAAWKITAGKEGQGLELVTQSKYEPRVRSPLNIALIRDKVFGDFVLQAEVMQTGKEYGHRDMCFFFGFQDPEHFYYAHLASKMDEHAHNIFVVNAQPRAKISRSTTDGVKWGDTSQWHIVRLERKASDGTVKVYFDDLDTPIMTARDQTFGPGFVGFGSFDDTGKIDNVKIWASSPPAAKETPSFNKSK